MSKNTQTTIDRPFARLHVRGRRCAPIGDQPDHVTAPLDAVPVAIYCRTSARGQRIGSQYDGCRKHCDRLGYAVVREYLEEWHSGDAPYFDPMSGYLGNVFDRPLLRQLLLEAMITRPFDRIVCWSSDRWSRMPGKETLHILGVLRRLGVGLEFVVQDLVAELASSLVERADSEEEAQPAGGGRCAQLYQPIGKRQIWLLCPIRSNRANQKLLLKNWKPNSNRSRIGGGTGTQSTRRLLPSTSSPAK